MSGVAIIENNNGDTLNEIGVQINKMNGRVPGQMSGGSSASSPPDITTSGEVTTIEIPTDESISGVLRYCKRILYSYLRLLGVMGLKPFSRDSPADSKLAIFMNKVYVVIVTLILLFGYILQYLTCFRRDTGFAYRNDTRLLTESWGICSGSPIFIHIPNALHLVSFLYMIYLYRDNEQLENLMERVFIQAANAQTSFFSQRRLIRNLQLLVVFSVTWLALSCAAQLFQCLSNIEDIQIHLPFYTHENLKRSLVAAMSVSNAIQDAIQVTIIISYCVHAYLLSTYLNLLRVRVLLSGITLRECVKEIGEFTKLLNYFNEDLSKGLAPLLLGNASLAISALAFLTTGSHLKIHIRWWEGISIGVTTFLWVIIFILPVTQAANLGTACSRLKTIGHLIRMRPFGYQNHSQSDLDSFLLFVSTLRIDVSIMRIPISTSILVTITSLLIFGLIAWGLIWI